MCLGTDRRSVPPDPADKSWRERESTMILATTKVKDLDHFLEVYGTAGADKRGSHGSKGSTVYRDPIEEDRVWAVFDWDEAGWTAFATDPETPGIMQEAGHLGRPLAGAVPRSLLGLAPHRRSGRSRSCQPPAPTTPLWSWRAAA